MTTLLPHAPSWRGPALLAGGAGALALSLAGWFDVVGDSPFAHTALRAPADLSVYQDAASFVAYGGAPPDGAPPAGAQEQLYGRPFGVAGLPFLYPPFAAVLFRPFAAVPLDTLALWTALASLAALLLTLWAATGMLGRARTAGRAGACLLVAAGALWLEPVQQNLTFGQVNVVLMALVTMDLAVPDHRWWKGVGIGLAAGIKLAPGLFLLYLLLTRRFRAAAVAAGTMLATVGAGWLLLPRASRIFWTSAVGGSPDGRTYLPNQSLNGALLRLSHNAVDATAGLPWLLICASLAAFGLLGAVAAARHGRELLAVCVIAALMLLCSPLSWTHHWVWVVPALALAGDAALRRLPLGVWALLGICWLFAAWPMRITGSGAWDPVMPLLPYGLLWYVPHVGERELQWDPFQMMAGNLYVLLGVVFVVGAAHAMLGRPRPVRPARVPAPATEAPVPAART